MHGSFGTLHNYSHNILMICLQLFGKDNNYAMLKCKKGRPKTNIKAHAHKKLHLKD